jgi:hypothetical protein
VEKVAHGEVREQLSEALAPSLPLADTKVNELVRN